MFLTADRVVRTALAFFLATLLAACGGGSSPLPPPATAVAGQLPQATGLPMAQATPNAIQILGARQVLTWAEQAYPALFPQGSYPSNQVVQASDTYMYRYYSRTGNYLAVAGQGVYLLGPASGNVLTHVGNLDQFACRINPSACRPGRASATPILINDWGTSELVVLRTDLTSGVAAPVNSFSTGRLISTNSHYDAAADRLYLLTNTYPSNTLTFAVVDGVSTASGAVAPSLSVETNLTSTTGYSMFLDRTNDVLYVSGTAHTQANGSHAGFLATFTNISAARGRVTASRTVTFPDKSVYGFAVDTSRNIAYVAFYDWLAFIPNFSSAAGSIAINTTLNIGAASMCNASATVTSCPVAAASVALDAARNRLYVADSRSGSLSILSNASAMTGSGSGFPVEGIRAVSYDPKTDRLIAGATYLAYVFNNASTLGSATAMPSSALTLQGTLNSSMTGFAFP